MSGSHLANNSSKQRGHAPAPRQEPVYDDFELDLDQDADLDLDADYDLEPTRPVREQPISREQSVPREQPVSRPRPQAQAPARPAGRAPARDSYDDGYDQAYNRRYVGYEPEPRRGGGWKIAVLVVVLLLVLGAMGYLLWQLFGGQIMDMISGPKNTAADIAPGITTQVSALDSTSSNMSGNLTVTQGEQRPEAVEPEDDVVLLDITWTGKKELTEPLYITVSDPSFSDGDGLAVHHFSHTGTWEKIGTYTIQDHSVTFMVDELSPFAFEIIPLGPPATTAPSASPEPSVTPEPTATPEPTPAPIQAEDYGLYADVQEGVFAMAEQFDGKGKFVVALIKNLPEAAQDQPEPTADAAGDDTAEDGPVFTYVDAEDGSVGAEDMPEGGQSVQPAQEQASAYVLMNVDGKNLRIVEMPLVQAGDGTWCLGGPVTSGMVWTTRGEYYASNTRYALLNNGSYLNLDDSNTNVLLNDNRVRTRWRIQTTEPSQGEGFDTLDYYIDGDRHYIGAMEMLPDELTAEDFPVGSSSAAPTDDNPQTVPDGQVVYIGGQAPTDQTVTRQVLHCTTTIDDEQALWLCIFRLDDSGKYDLPSTAAETAPESRIVVPEINSETDLSTLIIRDGGNVLSPGVDYVVSARIYNGNVIVTIHFMGRYSGQIVRTYQGVSFQGASLTEPTATPEPSASPEPSATPEPTTTPDAGNNGGGNNGGGNNGGTVTVSPTPGTGTEAPPATQPTPTTPSQPTPTTPAQSTPTPPTVPETPSTTDTTPTTPSSTDTSTNG